MSPFIYRIFFSFTRATSRGKAYLKMTCWAWRDSITKIILMAESLDMLIFDSWNSLNWSTRNATPCVENRTPMKCEGLPLIIRDENFIKNQKTISGPLSMKWLLMILYIKIVTFYIAINGVHYYKRLYLGLEIPNGKQVQNRKYFY